MYWGSDVIKKCFWLLRGVDRCFGEGLREQKIERCNEEWEPHFDDSSSCFLNSAYCRCEMNRTRGSGLKVYIFTKWRFLRYTKPIPTRLTALLFSLNASSPLSNIQASSFRLLQSYSRHNSEDVIGKSGCWMGGFAYVKWAEKPQVEKTRIKADSTKYREKCATRCWDDMAGLHPRPVTSSWL